MTIKPPRTTLRLHDFKANLCDYLQRLHAGEAEYLIRRYNRTIAIVLSTRIVKLNQDADRALAAIKLRRETLDRHAGERRHIRARALTHWPEEKYCGFGRARS